MRALIFVSLACTVLAGCGDSPTAPTPAPTPVVVTSPGIHIPAPSSPVPPVQDLPACTGSRCIQ